MRILFVLAFTVFFNTNAISQQPGHVITLTPALMSMGVVAIQPGYQFPIGEKFAIMTEVAIPVATHPKHDFNKVTSLRVSSELKLYPKHAIEGRYFALQLGYAYRKFFNLDSGRYNTYSDTATGYSSAVVKTPVFYSNLVLGRELLQEKKFYLGFFIALGIRFIPTRYDAKGEYPVEGFRRPDSMPQLPPSWEQNRNYLRLGGSIGLRVGLKI